MKMKYLKFWIKDYKIGYIIFFCLALVISLFSVLITFFSNIPIYEKLNGLELFLFGLCFVGSTCILMTFFFGTLFFILLDSYQRNGYITIYIAAISIFIMMFLFISGFYKLGISFFALLIFLIFRELSIELKKYEHTNNTR